MIFLAVMIFNVELADRHARYTRWMDAVKRTLGWESVGEEDTYDSPGNFWKKNNPVIRLHFYKRNYILISRSF